MRITWIAQGGFMFDEGPVRLVVDPYLSDACKSERLVPAPLSVEQLAPSAVFCTHDHTDHLDPIAVPRIAERYPQCRLMGPESVAGKMAELGISEARIESVEVGQRVEIEPLTLTAMPAHHTDPHAVGLLVRGAGRCVYVSGDTEYAETLAEDVASLAKVRLDAMLVCINGRLGNMNAEYAARVAAALRPRVAIPMHYGLFASNTADPQPFVDACAAAGIHATTLEVGRTMELAELLAPQ